MKLKSLVSAGLALAIVVAVTACSSKPAADEARMPAASKDFSGESYKDVVSDLKGAGFTDVKAEPLGDLIISLLHHPGQVKDVEVAGSKDDFDKGATFKKNVEIVVEYHSEPAKSSPSSSESSSAEPSSTPSASALPAVLTTANSADLAALLQLKNAQDPSVATFATKYAGQTVEFDAAIDVLVSDPKYATTDDFTLTAVGADGVPAGPEFGLEGYAVPAGVTLDTQVKVVASVSRYDEPSGEIMLLLTSMTPEK